MWVLVEPGYRVSGYIRLAPALQDILRGTQDSGGVANYGQFVNTQAMSITSPTIRERVLDELKDKNLSFFKGPDPRGNVADRVRAYVDKLSGTSGPMDAKKKKAAS